MPQSLANAASERIRSGLSPNTMRSLRRGVGSDAKAVSQCWGGLGGEVVEHGVVGADLGVEVEPAAC